MVGAPLPDILDSAVSRMRGVLDFDPVFLTGSGVDNAFESHVACNTDAISPGSYTELRLTGRESTKFDRLTAFRLRINSSGET
jgi:hypothetical protein